MSDIKVIPLKCPACGAQLDIPSEGSKATCSFCGTPLVIERDDAGVMLKPLTDSLALVRAELDRTTAALAVRRLQDEIQALKKEREQIEVDAKAKVNERYAEIALVKSRSSMGNVITLCVIVFLTVFLVVQLLIDRLSGTQQNAWIGIMVATLAAGGTGLYNYLRTERARGTKMTQLSETLNAEWASAQRHITLDVKRLNNLHAELLAQERIAN